MECWLASVFRALSEALTGPLVPLRVTFRHRFPDRVGPFEEFFGCPVQFSMPRNSLRFPIEPLRQEMIGAEPRAAAKIEEVARGELRTLAPEFTTSVAEYVRRAIEAQEAPQRKLIARHMGLSERTLRRRLEDEGATFRAIVDRVRSQIARALLATAGHDIADVAQAVGFENSATFARAFRRWTGDSPSRYRAKHSRAAEHGPEHESRS